MQVKSKNLIIAVVAVLVIGAVWYSFVYSPMKSKTSKANTAAHNAQLDADNTKKAIDDFQALTKKAAKDVGTQQMLAAVPTGAAESQLLRSLDALLATSGAGWQSTTPGPPTAAGPVASYNVTINVVGTEGQLARYLAGLYKMKRVFIPDNVTITSNECDDGFDSAGHPCVAGALFKGGEMSMTISGRAFAGPAAAPNATPTGSSGSTGASTSGATTTATH